MVKTIILLALAIGSISAFRVEKEKESFTCEECVRELRIFGKMVIGAGKVLAEYLKTHWCPAQGDEDCHNQIELEYPKMLDIVVIHFFLDGAIFVCQAEGICPVLEVQEVSSLSVPEAKEYTCQECVAGMEYVERLMKDPLFVDQMVLRLEQTYCFLAENEAQCKKDVQTYFPSMHATVVNHFLVPVDICAQQPVCGGDGPPTKPPTTHK